MASVWTLDVFTVVVLIAIIFLLVYLIIIAIYAGNLSRGIVPSLATSSFLFWTTIVLAVVTLIIAIWALIRLFTYTVPVVETVVAPVAAPVPQNVVTTKQVETTTTSTKPGSVTYVQAPPQYVAQVSPPVTTVTRSEPVTTTYTTTSPVQPQYGPIPVQYGRAVVVDSPPVVQQYGPNQVVQQYGPNQVMTQQYVGPAVIDNTGARVLSAAQAFQ